MNSVRVPLTCFTEGFIVHGKPQLGWGSGKLSAFAS